MLDRNRRIKEKAERFQESKEQFDVILTCEERCYDLVIANFEAMENTNEQPVHVINIDIVSS
jgi:RNA polymerase II subunit A C-terminal domain phosphatase SSU72